MDDVTHCPINKPGEKVQAHIVQANLEDNAYVSEMYVGNPPQLVKALFDTGSTNTWVLNSMVDLGGAVKERSYNNVTSTSSHFTPQKAQIFFGSGNLAGHFITDDIRLGSCDGSKSSGQIHIKNQKFGNVEKQHTIFTGSNFEAIVGLAYPALAERGVTPVFDEMINQQLLKGNVFAFYLSSVADEKQYGVKSDLTFGYYDKTKFDGDVHWNDILFQYMFGVRLDDIKVGGKSMGICQNKAGGCLITFDSGTSLMSVPTFAFHALANQKIPTAHTFVECTNKAQFGEFTLVIGGKDYNLTPDEWMFDPQQLNLAQGGQKMEFKMGPLGPQILAQVDSAPEAAINTQTEVDSEKLRFKSRKLSAQGQLKESDGKTVCASSIMKMDIKKEMFLVGDVFMRKFYTIFDRDNNRVGLAKAHSPQQQAALAQQSKAALAQASKTDSIVNKK